MQPLLALPDEAGIEVVPQESLAGKLETQLGVVLLELILQSMEFIVTSEHKVRAVFQVHHHLCACGGM